MCDGCLELGWKLGCDVHLACLWTDGGVWFRKQQALSKLLLFHQLEQPIQTKIVMEMYEREVKAGEILIKQGDTGMGASELYVVKMGKFEVSRFIASGIELQVVLPGLQDTKGAPFITGIVHYCVREACHKNNFLLV